jgi:hypothetical protein
LRSKLWPGPRSTLGDGGSVARAGKKSLREYKVAVMLSAPTAVVSRIASERRFPGEDKAKVSDGARPAIEHGHP